MPSETASDDAVSRDPTVPREVPAPARAEAGDAVLESLGLAVFTVDADHRLTAATRPGRELLRRVLGREPPAEGAPLRGVRGSWDLWWRPRIDRALAGESPPDAVAEEAGDAGPPLLVSIGPVREGSRVVAAACLARPLGPEEVATRRAAEDLAFLKGALDALSLEIFIKDRQSRFTYWNRPVSLIQGRQVDIGGKIDPEINPSLREQMQRYYEEEQELMASGQGFTDRTEILGRYALVSSKQPLRDPDGRVVGLVGANHYLTELVTALREARKSQDRYQSLVDAAPVGLFVHRDGRVLYVNPEGRRMFGADRPDEWVGRSIAERVHPDDRRTILSRIARVVADGRSLDPLQARFVRLDGTVLHGSTLGIAHEWEGEPAVLSIIIDTSERTRAEEALLATEREKAAILDSILDPVVYHGPDRRVIWANRAYAEAVGTSAFELVGHDCPLQAIARCPDCPVREAAEQGVPKSRERRSDNGSVWAIQAVPVLDPASGRVVGVVETLRDLTVQRTAEAERRKLEEGMMRTQRLESLGVLAGGIAHDFNNILAPIIGFTELLLAETPEDAPAYERLRQVGAAGARARDLVAQILAFSRGSEPERREARLQPVIAEAMELVRASLPSTIGIVHEIDGACDPAVVDPSQLHQIVMNLCTNAAHAMAGASGTLTVALERAEVDEPLAARLGCQGAGRYACLSVTDTGCGMSPETLDRALEPFFTTKPQGEGTGLGLSTVHGIAQSHGGGVRIYSEVGRGTTVSVYLPVVTREAAAAAPGRRALQTGSESVLVVDDEPALEMLTAEMLRTLGYRVESFHDSREALRAFREDPAGFDLVVTDQTMPHLTGNQLAAAVRFLRPRVPVLITTGYRVPGGGGEVEPVPTTALLMKPYTLSDLSAAVRAALDAAPPRG